MTMKALRSRQLVVLLVVQAGFWIVWMSLMTWTETRDVTGRLDSALSQSARQALMSLPKRIADMSSTETFAAPPPSPVELKRVNFQLWDLRTGRLLMRTPSSPTQPFVPDFGEGFNDSTAAGGPWRAYAVSDVERRVQIQMARAEEQIKADIVSSVLKGLGGAMVMFVCLASMMWITVVCSFRPMQRAGEALRHRDRLDFTPLALSKFPLEVHPFVNAVNDLQARQSDALMRERQFLSDAAHELRTPLAALTTQAQQALRATDAAHRDEALLQVLAGTRRATRLAEQLLDQAQLDAHDCLVTDEVDLASLVSLEVREFDARAQAKAQHIRLEIEPTVVRANVDAVGVLIRNLIDNALRHAPTGARVEILCRAGNDGEGVLTVRDDGPGIPAADCERVFERFYRVSGSKESGSGIGLSLVARIARMHSARVSCGEGIDGKGWCVSIAFPAAGAPP
jgi:two-component system OmpR family sensor kinase